MSFWLKSFSFIEGHPFWISDLAAACSFKKCFFGHCNFQPEISPQRPPPTSSPNLQLLKTSNSTKHFLAGSFGGFLYKSFRSRFPFLSFHCPFNILSFPFMFLSCLFLSFHCPFNFLSLSFPFLSLSFSMSFPFISFLFLSFNLLSFPFISNSNQDFLGFFWKSHYLGPTLDQGGGY